MTPDVDPLLFLRFLTASVVCASIGFVVGCFFMRRKCARALDRENAAMWRELVEASNSFTRAQHGHHANQVRTANTGMARLH